jgi:dipeptidyl aminopeptidase/acylaminoacyl peptidase
MKQMLLSLLAVWSMAAVAATKPTPYQFFSPSRYADVKISPGGDYLAVTSMEGEDARLVIYKLPERTTTYSSTLGDRVEIDEMVWASDEYMLLLPARRFFGDVKGRTSEMHSINARTGKIERLIGGGIADLLPDDPKHIIIYGRVGDDPYSEVFRVDITNGVSRRLMTGPTPRGGFLADAEGNIVFGTGVSSANAFQVHRKVGQKWELVSSTPYGSRGWHPFANGPQPHTWLTWDTRGTGTTGVGLYNDQTEAHEMLYQFAEIDIGEVYRDYTYRVYAVRTDLHFPAVHYLSKSHPLARISAGLKTKFPDETVTITSETRDNSKAIVLVQGDRNPGQFLLVDLTAKRVEPLFSRKPELARESLSPMLPIELNVRDGTKIYGYITSAPDTPKPGPMVVYIHGGPHGIRDYWRYDAEVQLMASQGVHVLQVNYRGSGGYGLDYETAGHGQWGARMQDDVTDATLWAINNKVADPARICIFGASYGAYSALMGVAREPDLYRCAVGYSGLYDLTLMEKAGDIQDAGIAYIHEVLGNNDEHLRSISPVYLADRIKADVMLIHGVLDRRTPIQHAKRMRSALEDNGKQVEWLVDIEQGHGFFGVADQLKVHQKISAFIGKHLGIDVSGISWEKPEGL